MKIHIKRILSFYKEDGITWFRVSGFGLLIKDVRKVKLLFSERNGYRGRRFGNYFIHVLTPNNF